MSPPAVFGLKHEVEQLPVGAKVTKKSLLIAHYQRRDMKFFDK